MYNQKYLVLFADTKYSHLQRGKHTHPQPWLILQAYFTVGVTNCIYDSFIQVPTSRDSVTMSQHEQNQNLDTKAPTLN